MRHLVAEAREDLYGQRILFKIVLSGIPYHLQRMENVFKFKFLTGNQPPGKMTVSVTKFSCSGYPNDRTIELKYEFADGCQTAEHSDPGAAYTGIRRVGYLPDNSRGRTTCRMLKVAFKRRLVFTIGRSRTTGKDSVITWNDIHHKTDPRPQSRLGYPDPKYLDRVTEELAVKGVTEKDIQDDDILEGVLIV
ncbi:E3 ubiquitin-protein ligase DTX3L-like [Mya arenaria]|uniref:E3 ubiquitin-protein ligase DTX3L-like n=1 Tax=Mya arenaria TaxID=6604 RepID=UPI0022E871DC|nr:E3 ubiquitin-protein ligase DTX3L-like [Mya arenaria]